MYRTTLSAAVALCLLAADPSHALRVYFVGNSVTDAMNYNGVDALATAAGYTHDWGRHMIPGAPLEWLWGHPADGFMEQPYGYPSNALPNYTWDAISLQPFDRHIEGTGNDREMFTNYMNLAKGKSPQVQFYIYERWPRTPGDVAPTDASLTSTTWANLWSQTFTGGWDNTNETRDFNQDLLAAVRPDHTDMKAVLIVPIGDVMYEFNRRAGLGQISGYSDAWALYSDGIHLNNVGSYLAGLTMYFTLYKRDPRGTAVPSDYGTINTTLRNTIQDIVYGIVSVHTYAGVSGGVATEPVSPSPRATATRAQTTNTAYTVDGRRASGAAAASRVVLRAATDGVARSVQVTR
jgi:hypothetical protein